MRGVEQFVVVCTNQSIQYGDTGVRYGSVTGGGLGRRSILYDWLIPNCNSKQYIGIVISLVGCLCVKSTEGLECGGNGRIILGGAMFDRGCFVRVFLVVLHTMGLFHCRYK